jgi:hypothetical protein
VELEMNHQLHFLDVLVNWHPDNSVGNAVYRKATHMGQIPADSLTSSALLTRGLSSPPWWTEWQTPMTRLAGPQNYNILRFLSEPVATPCRISTQHQHLETPTLVKVKLKK